MKKFLIAAGIALVTMVTPSFAKDIRLKPECWSNRCVYYTPTGDRAFSLKKEGRHTYLETSSGRSRIENRGSGDGVRIKDIERLRQRR